MSKILISAGHHPAAPGVKNGDFVEHPEAVVWRDVLGQILGEEAVIVPTGYLRDKVAFINRHDPDLAVEIHFNAYARWEDADADGVVDEGELIQLGRGSETLYYPGSSKGRKTAEAIQQELARVFPPNRGAKEGWYRTDPKFGPDFFLAKTRCPSVIIEPEFVANAEKIRHHRSSGCAAIARGIINALS